jgi:hypothetical protein
MGAGCPATDQRGAPRPSGPACDIGAYETTPPAATTGPADSVTSSGARLNGTVTANQSSSSVRFEYGKTTAYGATSAAQQVGGFSPTSVAAQLSGLSPNTTYHYRLVATSADGTTVGSDRTFTTTTPAAPKLASLSMHPSAFRTTKRKGHRHDKTGTQLSYTDSQASTTSFTVFKCTKMKKRRCTHYARKGKFTHKDLTGRNSFHWSGKLGRKRLSAGRYRLVATARSGRLASRPLRTSFRVVG